MLSMFCMRLRVSEECLRVSVSDTCQTRIFLWRVSMLLSLSYVKLSSLTLSSSEVPTIQLNSFSLLKPISPSPPAGKKKYPKTHTKKFFMEIGP